MSKERKTSSKFLLIFLSVVLCAAIGVVVWFFQGELAPRVEIRVPDPRKNDIYDAYSVVSLKGGEGLYYIQLKDVVCDASAPSNSQEKHYFRISITFETNTKENAASISKKYPEAVKILRETVAGFRPSDMVNVRTMEYVKTNMKRRLESVTGKGTVSAVYFEEVLGQ